MAAKKQSVHYGLELDLTPKVKLSATAKTISIALNRFTQEELSTFQRCLIGKAKKISYKSEQCDHFAQSLDFATQEAFDAFFTSLPIYLQKLIKAGCLNPFIDIRSQDWSVDENLIIEDTNRYHYYYLDRYTLNPTLRLGLFTIRSKHVLQLEEFFVNHFRPFLYKEEDYTPQPSPSAGGEVYSVQAQIHEVFPLFIESMIPLLKERDTKTIIRKGLLKAQIKDLRSLCGLPPFPLSSAYNLDPLVLLAKFVLSFESNKLKRPEDGMALIKTMVQRMFFQSPANSNFPFSSFFEYCSLLDQCSLNGNYAYSVAIDFASRKGMVNMLTCLKPDDGWYSVEELFQFFIVRGDCMLFANEDVLSSALTIRGQKIQMPYAEYGSYDDKGFRPTTVLQRPLFERPLFNAYLYLLASLGILEISETQPPLLLTKNEKLHPLTPYEALDSVRLTEFGAWCMNMVEQRPQPKKQVFETITDKELLLVTFKGKSLERRLFLEQIGIPLGVERFRITEASFIRGCSSSSDIVSRIDKFKLIIDPDPSDRWKQFFASLEKRSTLFCHGEQVLLYTFPDDPEIRRMFATDPAFKKLLIRAEDNKVVVRKGNQKAFQKLLMEHGYLNTL